MILVEREVPFKGLFIFT